MDLYLKMNEYLANQQVMFVKLHNLHWYVKGKEFFVLHAKLEELYNQTAEAIDAIAERLLMIGGMPVGSLKASLKLAKISELDDKLISGEEAVKVLFADVKWWVETTKKLIDVAEKADDQGTADMFLEYLGQYQKLAWMLDQYLK